MTARSAITTENAPVLGDEFGAEVDAALDRIEFWPKAWSRATQDARVCKTKRFPYGIVYLVERDEIVLVAVAHLHRSQGYWKKTAQGSRPVKLSLMIICLGDAASNLSDYV